MNRKFILMTGMVLGSSAGSWIPMLWGAGWFSLTSVFFGFLGGLGGIWAAYRLTR